MELADFSDVPVTHQARTAVAWANQNGVMVGVGGGKFNPDAAVSRQELASLLTRYAKLNGKDTSADASVVQSFTDRGSISSWAAGGVAYCVKAGLMQGNGQVFSPTGTATRAEVSVILMNIAA